MKVSDKIFFVTRILTTVNCLGRPTLAAVSAISVEREDPSEAVTADNCTLTSSH
jgi:hypothetical protein